MGKPLLLFVSLVLLGAFTLLYHGPLGLFDAQEETGDYAYRLIARDMVTSGFDAALAGIARDRMAVARQFREEAAEGGAYDVIITDDGYGDLSVHVDGESGGAHYEVDAHVLFTAPFPAALSLDDDVLAVRGIGDYVVSGVDRRMPSRAGGAGYLEPARGLLTDSSHLGIVTAAMNTDRIVGAGTTYAMDVGSVSGGFDGDFFEALFDEARDQAQTTVGRHVPVERREPMIRAALHQAGSGEPRIVRVEGDLALTSALAGCGLLLVEDGDLTIASPDVRWEGLILVRRQHTDSVSVRVTDGARVYGALVAYKAGQRTGAARTGTGRLDFTIGTGAEIHYSSEALAKLGRYLDTVGALTRVTVTGQAQRSVLHHGGAAASRAALAADDPARYGRDG